MDHDTGLKKWLGQLHEFGISFVDGVPPTVHDTEKVSTRIAHIRETHYGKLWQLRPDLEHGDTAYTKMALSPHTDTTYFTDPIGLQFFHVLHHKGTGGHSVYVDGFHIANQLKQQKPWAHEALSRIHISAHCAGDVETLIRPNKPGFPIIKTDDLGNAVHIRYNNDDRSTLNPHHALEFYAALKEWDLLLKDPANQFWIQLVPGRAVMIDNWRVLHGRSAFTGDRQVVGCYHGHDDYKSRLETILFGSRALRDI